MSHETLYHEWVLPDEGDTDYATRFNTWFDALDEALAERADDPSPERSRWLVDNRGDWPTLAYDNATSIRQIETTPRWDALPFTARDREEEVIGRWEWLPASSIDADITGRAVFADEADEAEFADVTTNLDGRPVTAFASRRDPRTVTEPWTFRRRVDVSNGMRVTGGTLGLPSYE